MFLKCLISFSLLIYAWPKMTIDVEQQLLNLKLLQFRNEKRCLMGGVVYKY